MYVRVTGVALETVKGPTKCIGLGLSDDSAAI